MARIDGVDELHLSASEARWVHEAFDAPQFVSIAGQEWDPSRVERFEAEIGQPFLPAELDLAGAEIVLVRGRGSIDFRHGPDALVIRFDDSLGGGADEYEVLVRFADELCAAKTVLGDASEADLRYPTELLIEARVDGRDELHLSTRRADWLHLAWSWPEDVRLGGVAWAPEEAPLEAPEGTGFFDPTIELDKVKLEVDEGRGSVTLEVAGDRLFLKFDDDGELGADDYVVRLLVPKPPRRPEYRVPTGEGLRVEVSHALASDVAGAKLQVLAESPSSGEFVPWPGLRGLDFDGRCVVALPAGSYVFEVLHLPRANRLVAIRTDSLRVTRAKSIALPAAEVRTLSWSDKGKPVELRELAVQSQLASGEVRWAREAGGGDLELVVSPREEFDVRAFGSRDLTHFAWWSRRRFGESAGLDSSRQGWVQSSFDGFDGATLPADCEGSLRSPAARFDFPITQGTQLFTNRRFVSFSYSHALAGGGRAVFHEEPVLLPKTGRRHVFHLGGELTAKGSAAILLNENLGSPETKQLWWELNLVDGAGRVLDTEASAIEWKSEATMRDGSVLPGAPLTEDGLAALADPVQTVELGATYRWDGEREARALPMAHVVEENERYSSIVPGHLGSRARAYLDKARRTYEALEIARGKAGEHSGPIELKWWMNGGAIGAWGSITMPIAGMNEDYDWFSFPWALAHESLHAFGYHHGPELDRLDRAAIQLFEEGKWAAERDPDFVPADW